MTPSRTPGPGAGDVIPVQLLQHGGPDLAHILGGHGDGQRQVGRTALRREVPSDSTGSSLHRMENTCISSRATKKLGRALPMKLQNRRK